MDAVGDLLAQRQDDRFSWGGAILLALLLHAGVLTGFLLSSMAKPVKYARPRAVAVRLLQAGAIHVSQPVKPAEPAPPPAAEKPKIEKPPEEAPPQPSSKAVLLPSKDDKKKKPTPPPVSRPGKSEAPAVSLPSAGDETATATGPAPGAGGTAGVGGFKIDQSDFNYPYYIERLALIIGMNWFKPTQGVTTNPVVHFQILKDGTIADARIVVSSGLPFVDRAALRAVLASSPLPPLPAEYGRSDIGIQVVFD
ncbi:MAG TPA: energy transducer TonB [Thermoanaerobaculia bacterium]|jgi:protein TonB